MKIESFKTFSCDAGWRNYNFLRITTDTGIEGWSEYDEAYGPPGLTAVIEAFAARLIGRTAANHEPIFTMLFSTTRPAPDGMAAEALGAIENALLDIKARALGIPCHQLLGGKHRDSIPIYWSHCATWRISHPTHYGPAINSLDDVKGAGRDAREAGFKALKTNLFVHGAGRPKQWMAGFSAPYLPSLNIDPPLIKSIRAHLEALADGAGPDVELMIDLNFNARTEGFLRLVRELNDYKLLWVELDSYNPEALALIRQQSTNSICALETMCGVRQFLPFFRKQSVDVAIIDAIWNGAWQSMKIANVADGFDVNIAPHNFYSHLATMINVQFAAAVPNLRIMEHDVDRLRWDDKLFDSCPVIENGAIKVSDAPGWGCVPNLAALEAHPAQPFRSYLGF